jgi:hypothetical protein
MRSEAEPAAAAPSSGPGGGRTYVEISREMERKDNGGCCGGK